MQDEYLTFDKMLKRDFFKTSNNKNKYQIQALKDTNEIKFVKINNDILDICTYNYTIDNFTCCLIQYKIDDDDIKNNNLPMIGFLIKTNNKVIGSLILYYVSPEFHIVLSNSNNQHKILKKMKKYCGNEEIVYELMELLGDCLGTIIEEN